MKTLWKTTTTPNGLIVCALGWGTTPEVMVHLDTNGFDVVFCWDYRQAKQLIINQDYNDYRLVAWSFGVWAAEENLAHLPYSHAIAINGTRKPIDKSEGISPAIFSKTLTQLSPETHQQFLYNMCADDETVQIYRQFFESDIQILRNELAALEQRYQAATVKPSISWTRAIVGEKDRIFSPRAQQRHWKKKAELCDVGHYFFHRLSSFEALW